MLKIHFRVWFEFVCTFRVRLNPTTVRVRDMDHSWWGWEVRPMVRYTV